jgi:hypothetical protein
LRLVHKDEAALGVAYAITKNFDKLPDNAQQPLFKLSDKDSVAGIVSSIIEDYGNKSFQRLLERKYWLRKKASYEKTTIGISRYYESYYYSSSTALSY